MRFVPQNLFLKVMYKSQTMIQKLKAIATAEVATSGFEGFNSGSLDPVRDRVVINTSRVLSEAKKEVIHLADNYTPLYLKK